MTKENKQIDDAINNWNRIKNYSDETGLQEIEIYTERHEVLIIIKALKALRADLANKSEWLDRVKNLKDVLDLQCSNGNWNYNGYMHGRANGLILAMNIIENNKDEPPYMKAPDVFLSEKETTAPVDNRVDREELKQYIFSCDGIHPTQVAKDVVDFSIDRIFENCNVTKKGLEVAIRVRKNGEMICASLSKPKTGDTYIDDTLHYQMSVEYGVICALPMPEHEKNPKWWWSNNSPKGCDTTFVTKKGFEVGYEDFGAEIDADEQRHLDEIVCEDCECDVCKCEEDIRNFSDHNLCFNNRKNCNNPDCQGGGFCVEAESIFEKGTNNHEK